MDIKKIFSTLLILCGLGFAAFEGHKRFMMSPMDQLTKSKKCIGCNFKGVDFSSKDLRGVDLSGAILVEANLKKANLTGAILKGTNFSLADLEQANFTKANIEGAYFFFSNAQEGFMIDVKGNGSYWVDGRKCSRVEMGVCR